MLRYCHCSYFFSVIVLAVALVELNACHKVIKLKEGSVRLVGGKSHFEGNVQIYHLGEWGQVCDDEWGPEDGAVICRQLGRWKLHGVTSGAYFGRSKKKIWMDNVWCSGYETSLSECRFDGWGQSDCDPSEAAGVICSPTPGQKHQPRVGESRVKVKPRRVKIGAHFGHSEIRLTGGRDRNEGRVEIRFNRQGDFGSVCGDGWSILEATQVCQHLNLGHAHAAPTHPVLHITHGTATHPASGNVALYHVKCEPNTTSWQHCTSLLHARECPDHRMAGVMCTTELADLQLDWREIARTIHLEDMALYYLQCAMEENCLAAEAYGLRSRSTDGSWYMERRRLLRFTAKTTNIGNADFRPFIPKHLWKFHQCHLHYHSMEVFATFDILARGSNIRMAQGHKASFCLEDNECERGLADRKYSCANFGDQGVSPNCSDVYRYDIDCQWIDISELSPGLYTFRVTINPEYKVPEQRYDNNAVTCSLYYVETYVRLYDCSLGS